MCKEKWSGWNYLEGGLVREIKAFRHKHRHCHIQMNIDWCGVAEEGAVVVSDKEVEKIFEKS